MRRKVKSEMTEMAMRSRLAALVVAALVSVSGALGTAAFLAADDAHAMGTYYSCWKYEDTYKCGWRT